MPSRRRVLVAASAGVAITVAWRAVGSNAHDAVVAVVRKRLDYLTLDEGGLHAFADDLVADHGISTGRLRLLDFAGPVYASLDLAPSANALARALRQGEERVVSLFLLSSDYFVNGADESKTVRYRGYYDPQSDPCGNPFARTISA